MPSSSMVLFKIDEDFDSDSKWKQMGVFRFVIEYKVSVVFCLKTSRLSFVLKTAYFLGMFLENMSFCWLKWLKTIEK